MSMDCASIWGSSYDSFRNTATGIYKLVPPSYDCWFINMFLMQNGVLTRKKG